MGQKKTWSLHHVPYTSLWENMHIDYDNHWKGIKDSWLLNKFYKNSMDKKHIIFYIFLNYIKKYKKTKLQVYKTPNLTITDKDLKQKVNCKYTWLRNANLGSNETAQINTHLVNMCENKIVINYFFREKLKVKSNIKNKKIIKQAYLKEMIKKQVINKKKLYKNYKLKKKQTKTKNIYLSRNLIKKTRKNFKFKNYFTKIQKVNLIKTKHKNKIKFIKKYRRVHKS